MELDARPAAEARIVRVAGQVERALAARMHGVVHQPLQGEKRGFPRPLAGILPGSAGFQEGCRG